MKETLNFPYNNKFFQRPLFSETDTKVVALLWLNLHTWQIVKLFAVWISISSAIDTHEVARGIAVFVFFCFVFFNKKEMVVICFILLLLISLLFEQVKSSIKSRQVSLFSMQDWDPRVGCVTLHDVPWAITKNLTFLLLQPVLLCLEISNICCRKILWFLSPSSCCSVCWKS